MTAQTLTADPVLFLSETRGNAIPKDFAEQVCENAIVDYAQWKDKLAALADMDSEGYWDIWEDVCQNMIIQDMYHSHKRYTLWQNGDLWLHPCSSNIQWVTEKDALTDEQLHEMYDEMLDDCYEEVKIAGLKYQTSYALKNLDPVAYRCGFADWLDGEVSEGNIFELNDAYYNEDPSEPEDYYDDPESHDGHYEWIIPATATKGE